MDHTKKTDLILNSLGRGVRWLMRNRSESGGWGDDPLNPTLGTTGHVLVCFWALGLADSKHFTKELKWLGSQASPQNDRFGLYWSERGLFTLDEPEHTLGCSLLVTLPLLLFSDGLAATKTDFEKLRSSGHKWATEIIERPHRHIRTHGMWQHFMVSWLLQALGYEGKLWSDLHLVLSDTKHPTDALWGPRQGEENKDTAQALLTFLHFPNPPLDEIQSTARRLLARAINNQTFACWPCATPDLYRGPMFATRWVLIAIARAARFVDVSEADLDTMSKAAAWLSAIQRNDGGWVEVDGNPFSVDDQRHTRVTGPGFVAYALMALAHWLLTAGISIQDIRAYAENEIHREIGMKFDAFICHASEDKDEVVRPLAKALRDMGFHIWYDEFQLEVGDSIRQSVERGLANSRYGIVILSQTSFRKNWVQYELNGLTAREIEGHKLILPVWHNVTKNDVLAYSPPLADKFGLNTTTMSIHDIALALADKLAK